MRERRDVYEADVRSDSGSSRSEEKDLIEKNDSGNPMRIQQGDSNSRPGSRKSGKSLRNEELEVPNYGSETSSSAHKPYGNPSNPVQYTDQERAELLRRLDSIKEHLIRGSNMVDKPKESDQPPMPFPGPGKHVQGPSFYRPYPEPFPYAGGNPVPMHGMYPSTSNPAHIPGYRDPFGFQMHRRPPNWHQGHYPNPMAHPYVPGQYVDIGSDILEPHPQDPMYHPFFPTTPSRYGDVPYSPVSHQREKFAPFGSHSYNSSSTFHSSMGSLGSHGHTRWPSDLDSEMGGAFARGYVQKAVSDTDARRCHPLAGGAPFIACHNCFELLYLPKKARFVLEKQQKLQCGACSEVISFSIVDKKFVFASGHVETSTVSRDVEDRRTSTAVKGAVLESNSHANQPSADLSSVDYNDSGNNLQCMDKEPDGESTKNRDTRSVQSLSPSEHPDDEKLNISDGQQRVVKSVRRRVKDTKAPEPTPAQSASLLELFEYSNINRVALSYGMAQLSFNSEKQESYSKQTSLKPESVATETEVSYDEYSNTEVSEDFKDSTRSKGDSRTRNRKGGGSGFMEATKVGPRDQNGERGKSSEVWVNGRLIPADQVKTAETLAGPIQSGNYWYDYRAGFWGVVGKPCLGIIPPFIEEFSHQPMPDNCAAGNTGVFVNGRELHHRDLDLLAGRGLPREGDRSYIVDISGRVLDGDSGEELDSLGKLAPTVEKVKHGFGMRVPRTLVS
ncbi:PREDICTED: uncharacterized protein LOC104801377 [Tarenaya hassleriana]|uniref:uncharacterized protein LOC104801377 n=1 Tax=Tarenaya hassleriana TaxID=28532 RepID=UPI00053C9808|nr:PREDICTED: uncharacterized protein LOC104801377 [Tarenaya hassleriana]XP_010522927.1 PREDICTED: uncharacterized protein LOC104801377 [Tarenaya hassleriana]